MNNIMDYRGYRFFQASFDPDELGTRLSVNHDFWGTWVSYIGYFLLYFGMLAILFDKNTRFNDLRKKLAKVEQKKASLLSIVLVLLSINVSAQQHMPNKLTEKQRDSIIMKYKVDEVQAEKFGRLVIQDAGRMKPVNTFSSELLRKVSKSDTYKGMNSDQVLISMTMFDQLWFENPIIYLKRGNDSLRTVLGLDKKVEYAALVDFFDKQGNYKLEKLLADAYREPVPNKFQTDFMDIDKRINLLYSGLTGQILKVYPIPGDINNKWVSFPEIEALQNEEMNRIKMVLPAYFQSLAKAAETGNYKDADFYLKGLQDYQHKYGKEVLPPQEKVETEILYNKYDIFKKLYTYYLLAGVLMFLFSIIRIFNTRKGIRVTVNVFHVAIVLLFALHTAGLIARWYVAGHAPWSNAYESVIYVGWATVLFGLIFGRKSQLTVASTAFVASIILWVAHQNWTDPGISTLQPVLNSYWLMIHVAVIVASYGPFTLGMILGLVALILMLFLKPQNKVKIELHIKELTYINEMALTVGLVMLTIGNFLGGQWANESWGRYWGWDPKETWALVSIMVYAFVIHMRFVPALRGTWIYNFFSVLAYAAILMTYFGVNFYLTGLHSYASGEVRTPMYFFWMALAVFILGILSYMQYRKHLKKVK